jgi:hypothetical protein
LEILGAIGGGAFILTSLVLGMRLMLLARRTRKLPEFSMGLGLFLMGGVAYPFQVVAQVAASLPLGLRAALMAFAILCLSTGTTFFAVTTWRIFRPGSKAAAAGAPLVAGALLLFVVLQCASQGGFSALVRDRSGPFRYHILVVALPVWWASFESFRYYGMLKRRLLLGLADPVVADRMRLWGMSTLIAASTNLVSIYALFTGRDPATWPTGAAIIGAMGLAFSAHLWLAFFPPQSYLQRVAARGA